MYMQTHASCKKIIEFLTLFERLPNIPSTVLKCRTDIQNDKREGTPKVDSNKDSNCKIAHFISLYQMVFFKSILKYYIPRNC